MLSVRPDGRLSGPAAPGFRLAGDDYCRIEPDASGSLVCEELDLLLRLEAGQLLLIDRTSGERLLTEGEAERQAREAAEAENRRLRNSCAASLRLVATPDEPADAVRV